MESHAIPMIVNYPLQIAILPNQINIIKLLRCRLDITKEGLIKTIRFKRKWLQSECSNKITIQLSKLVED